MEDAIRNQNPQYYKVPLLTVRFIPTAKLYKVTKDYYMLITMFAS